MTIMHTMKSYFYHSLHNPKRHRLDASCEFYQLDASLQSSCMNFVKIKLISTDLLQVVETTCMKLVYEKFRQSIGIEPAKNLQQTCYHHTGASNAKAS